jgi:hypothetical protein
MSLRIASRFAGALFTLYLEEHQKCRLENALRQRASVPGPRLKRRQIPPAVVIHPRGRLYHSRRKSIRGFGNRHRRLLCVSLFDN